MKKFGILIHGTGYDVFYENSKAKGFYVSVFVEAPDMDTAYQKAIDFLVNSEAYITAFLPDQHPNGMLNIETVNELFSFDDVPYPMTGFSFYKDDDISESHENPLIH